MYIIKKKQLLYLKNTDKINIKYIFIEEILKIVLKR